MAKAHTLSLLAHLPRLEPDGETHRRDCECVRCDAGFRPSEDERRTAHLRWEVRRARAAAERALERRRERARIKQAALSLELAAEARAVDARIRALRAARARTESDDRLERLRRLRTAGMPLAAAIAEVERDAEVEREAERERVGPAGLEPAAYGLKVRSSTN